MPRVDLDTYTPPAPALIEHGNSSSAAMRATASPSHKLEPSTITARDAGASGLPGFGW